MGPQSKIKRPKHTSVCPLKKTGRQNIESDEENKKKGAQPIITGNSFAL